MHVPSGRGIYWNVFTIRNGVVSFSDTIGQSSPGTTTQSALVDENQYLINVVDENGRPLRGASVTYDSQSATTDEYGNAYFDAFSFGSPVISVSMSGYLPWTNAHSSWEKDASRHETVVLYPESAGPLKVISARYSNFSNMSLSTELLTTTKKVSLGNNAPLTGDLDFGNFYIKCAAAEPANVKTYQLWQGLKKIAESTDGSFSLNTDKFTKGGNCFIRVIGKNGESVDTRINLVFALSEVKEDTSIQLGDGKISFTVGDNVPFLGGSNFDVKLPVNIPVTFFYSGDKIRIGFNVNIAGGDSPQDKIKEVKELTSSLKRMYGQKVGKLTGGQAMKYKSLIKNTNKWQFFKGGEINFLGYAEADFGSNTATGALILQGKIDPIGYDFNTWCVVVPVTVQVELSLEGNATFEISYNFDTSQLDGALSFAPSATLTAFGGIGISKLVGVGAYGSAKLAADFDILPKPAVNSVDLTGELGIKAYLGFFTYEKPFAYNTWHLYTRMNTRGDGGDDEKFDLSEEEIDLYRQLSNGIYDASNYKRITLDYLAGEKDHLGASADEKFVSRGSQDMVMTLRSLIENTYRNAQPVMVSAGNAIYAAFLRADSATGRVYTVVSKYDGRTWTSANATSSGDQLDNKPSLLVDNAGRVWLAYARTAAGHSDGSLLEFARHQEIVVGQIDKDTLAFTESRVYSSSSYAHMQQLSMVNGKPTLTWVCSRVASDNDVLWPEYNVIYKATCTDTVWGSASSVRTVENAITELAVGEKNGRLAIAYVADQDNDSNSAEDRQLFILSGTEPRAIAEGASSISFAAVPGSSSGFIWLQEGALYTEQGAIVDVDRLNGEYCISGNSIYFSAPTESGAELCMMTYENGAWSLPIVLTSGTGYLENISIANLNGADIVLGLYTDVAITDTEIRDTKDLVWSGVTAVSDLVIDDVTYDGDTLTPNEEFPLTVTFINSGDHLVTSVDVFLNDYLVGTESVSVAVGETATLTIDAVCPNSLSDYSVYLAETDWDDYHPDDNTFSFKVGYADLSIELEHRQIGSSTTVYGIIRNEGIQSASGRVFFMDLNGRVLYEHAFSSLRSGDVLKVSFPFGWDNIDVNRFDVKARVENDNDDLYDYNNVDVIHLTYSGHRKINDPEFVLPAMLKIVGSEAFIGARFRSVKVPDGVERIGWKAFADCERLEQIEIPASVTTIDADAFKGTSGFVIYCPEGSEAEAFAKAHRITCITE